ncbi:MAG: thioesterase [Desulfurococcales archaeon]|nr:thioesterase [Desulfurococcales archaeon]MCE4605496.1 thioesterase [Desulfurococcales archaeon]
MSVVECVERYTVEREHLAEHLARRGIEVLSTPCLILFMEKTARTCLDEAVGKPSVGVRVDVRHRRPIPLGGVVEVRVKGMATGGGYYLFSVKAYYQGELAAEGVHLRKVVDDGFPYQAR